MANILCLKIIIYVFAVLEMIVGVICISFGGLWMNHLDRTNNYHLNIGMTTLSMIFIVVGIINCIDVIIAIVGAAKKNQPLLIFHLVWLSLNAIGGMYTFIVAFSSQTFISLFITSLRIGVVFHLIRSLRSNPPRTDIPMTETSVVASSVDTHSGSAV
ncbi:hypothetical protein CHUAL_000142 [Chamberlinius hualienensis]